MSDHELNIDFCKDDVHGMFELSYASYLVLPRSVLQSMPADWQHDFVALVEKLQEQYGGYNLDYTVHPRKTNGQFAIDPLRDYQRGRRRVEPKPFDWGIGNAA